MATLTITIPAGNEAGAFCRSFGKAFQDMGGDTPDRVSSGASTVITIDNAPATGTASCQITGGPYTSTNVYRA